MARKILVTTALPYANGDIHLGHLLEHIQTDIWVRYHRLLGRECIYVCGDDAHGTATMLSAQKKGIAIEEWLKQMKTQHERDLRAFGMSYDNYYTTHSPENKEYSEYIYNKLRDKNLIAKRKVKQLFDPVQGMFLADRFIKGKCPKCAAAEQYGDNCEVCGATYDAIELKNPYSLLSKAQPVIKESEHYFFRLPLLKEDLLEWMKNGAPQQEVRNKLQEWFAKGLQEWNISRDAPYFGFTIPGHNDKYFYVWLDAPIGYIASLANFCKRKNWEFREIWQDENSSIFHFIGKDIVYFHCLFWPALLKSAELAMPTSVFAHGFVTINNEKMSKSRGTFILASHYLRYLDPEYIRYYFATKLSDNIEDIDFGTEEFKTRVNGDLVGKFVNIASRCAKFINESFDNQLAEKLNAEEEALFTKLSEAGENIAMFYEKRQTAKAMKEIMMHADQINRYIEKAKPWELNAINSHDVRIQRICTAGLNYFRLLALYLQPVVPNLVDRSFALLGTKSFKWEERTQPVLGKRVAPFTSLLERISNRQIEKLIAK